jgi:hypothetical protein
MTYRRQTTGHDGDAVAGVVAQLNSIYLTGIQAIKKNAKGMYRICRNSTLEYRRLKAGNRYLR